MPFINYSLFAITKSMSFKAIKWGVRRPYLHYQDFIHTLHFYLSGQAWYHKSLKKDIEHLFWSLFLNKYPIWGIVLASIIMGINAKIDITKLG